MIFMIVIIGLLFYFLILRPQRMEQRKRQQMLESVGKGDQVLTSGGVYGTVESVDQQGGTVTLSIAPKINVKFAKSAVQAIVKKKGKPTGEREPASKGK